MLALFHQNQSPGYLKAIILDRFVINGPTFICNLCHPIDSSVPTEDTVKRNLKGVIVNSTTVAIRGHNII